MAKLTFTPLAESDLVEILDYIAQDKPLAAEQVIAEIRGTCELLSNFPRLGRARQEIRESCRCMPVSRYVVYYNYSLSQDEVQIVRVVDGARDIDEVYFPE